MTTVHNQLKQYTALSRAYKNALGLDEGGLERAGETLQPTFPLFELPEYAVQRGELLGVVRDAASAVAGQYSGIGIGVAAASPYLVVLEPESWAMMLSGAVGTYYVRGQLYTDFLTNLANNLTVYSRDSRRWNGGAAMLNAPVPITGRWGAAAVPSGDLLGEFYCNNTTPFTQTLAATGPIVISPGYAVSIWGTVVNTVLRANLRLRARVLQPSEGSA
jgi:hypothetical protein